MAGQTVSRYRILEKIGGGGMGVVYLAEDPRLDRRVALKLLPEESGLDEIAVERFSREARAASALNHPNICTIYDVGESGGRPFLVMELLEGCTLRHRLLEGPIPPRETTEIALQIADALAAAHSRGILHRDIKPANLFLTARGQAKVLDFGLAKRISGRPKPELPGVSATTLTIPEEMITSPGTAVGTIAYMSPEQARGEELDARSDLFSLGIVLYEMATGALPFPGNTMGIIFDAILNRTPLAPSRHNPALPEELERVILKLLEKDRARRFQTAADLHSELKRLKGGAVANAPPILSGSTRNRKTAILALAALLPLLFILYEAFLHSPREAFSLAGATFTQLTSAPGEEITPTLSPDGKTMAYASKESGNWDIYLLRVGGKNPINLTKDSQSNDMEPAFSPDGDRIAFRSGRDGGGIFVMGATGESVRRVTDFGYSPTWSPEGKSIAFVTESVDNPSARPATSRLWVVDLTTGDKKQLTQTDAIQPRWSPHGDRIAYAGMDAGRRDVWTVPAHGGDPVPVTHDNDVDWSPGWSPDGRYLYFASDRGGRMNLWRLAIDEKSGKVSGQPEPVTTPSPYSGHVALSADGRRLAYVQWAKSDRLEKIAFDPVTEKVLGQPAAITQGSRSAFFPDASPDGQWLTFCSFERPEDIFVMRTDGSSLRNLTDDDFVDRFPRWSPGGNRIQFMSDRSGKYQG
jgi:eukaryotic-like serine/threonine-protein kinase